MSTTNKRAKAYIGHRCLSISLKKNDEPMMRELFKICKEFGISVSTAIRFCIKRGLPDIKNIPRF